ncbi:MAG TPA: ribokinase [Solibacterales bacterium]|nr:ribokinase [Bryobacterales bacterium]
MAQPRIRVLGSLNIDLVQRVPRMPRPGETLRAIDFQTFIGGKGANQACAAAKLGAVSEMAGCIGADVFGHQLMDELKAMGVDMSRVRTGQLPSGTATILVLPDGENVIVISSGANGEVSVPVAIDAVEDLRSGDILMCQLEIPLESVAAAMQQAYRQGVTTILDPAPACPLPGPLLHAVTILTPNQTEAGMLLSKPAVESVSDARQAAASLRQLGPRQVILKLGEQGCLVSDGAETTWVPGFSVSAVDTTAAGDAFNGALATALTRGQSLLSAARFACAAAALSVTRHGAAPSLACLAEVESLLASHTSTS